MDDIRTLLHVATSTFERLRIAYFVTGSIASVLYGRYRSTNDLDIVADISESRVEQICDAFPSPEFYISPDAVREAVRHRSMFNILHPDTGYKIDVIVPAMTHYVDLQFDRARRVVTSEGHQPMVISPEDMIISKMIFFREGGSDKHVSDSAGVVATLPTLDRPYIEHWSRHFGLLDIWNAILKRVEEAP